MISVKGKKKSVKHHICVKKIKHIPSPVIVSKSKSKTA